MFSALLVCSACVAFDQAAPVAGEPGAASAAGSAYRDAKSQVGAARTTMCGLRSGARRMGWKPSESSI